MDFSNIGITGKKILLVGKATQHHFQIARLLYQQNYAVHTTENIEEALNHFEKTPADLILLNSSLLELSTCDFFERFKPIRKIRKIPMIFISQTNSDEERIRAFASGATDYISTPIIVRELQTRIATHLMASEHLLNKSRSTHAERIDTSPQKRALRDHSALINCLFEASTIGVVLWRRDGILIDANDTFLRTLGLNHGHIRNRCINWLHLVIPEERETVARHLARLGRTQHHLPYEKHCRSADGRIVPMLVGSAHLEDNEDIGVSFVLDLSKQRKMEKELTESRQQLRDLAAHAEKAIEQERKRIAREMHDELGSLLTAMKMELSLFHMETCEYPLASQRRMLSMHRILEDAVRVTRQIASELRPAVLNLGLLAAVEWLAENFRQRSAIACSIEASGEIPLADARATALFRIIQESLTNVARHAHASEVTINITQKNGMLRLAIADNGCGFDPAAIGNQSFGLLGISERLEALAGNLVIDSSPGRGTTLRITMPIEEIAS